MFCFIYIFTRVPTPDVLHVYTYDIFYVICTFLLSVYHLSEDTQSVHMGGRTGIFEISTLYYSNLL